MDDVIVKRLPREEAFEVLAHETRLGVLDALNEADEPLPFEELRTRVGVDDPGQFNYHLGKLVGHFVEKGDDGYELSEAGLRVVGAVLSGGYTSTLDAEPIPMDTACMNCGAPMEARFRDAGITIGCTDCTMDFMNANVPAGALEGWSREDVPSVVDRWMKRYLAALDHGFCDFCDGRIERNVYTPDDEIAPEWVQGNRFEARVIFSCHRCTHQADSMIPYLIPIHPAIDSFHFEHGINVRETPMWELDWLHPGITTLTSEDPIRLEIPVTLDSETRTFVFDADLDFVTTREK
ncbi:hypothetical protein A4G99_01195 [Haladaptatus sp. R4]|uniref:winged helix-turn-helix domain-containing protein n=1 Tax=Haladaptatus sp. R4 TaxID=1679489 RepID=UPI0007B499CD|nr:helix-turn-helix domain-containing protein [Haladaptatus sp. R4]KZN25170.1 hypothetical protein A4G99_01195 [Haladaptatus sp. R4]